VGILDDDVTRVRDQTDIVTLIGESVALKRVGQRFQGLCPFHQEKTPSFSVNPDGFYYCFGCQASGDAITFLRETEHLDFVDAVERLAQRAGITLRYDDKSHQRDRSRRGRLVEAVTAAVAYYHGLLLESPLGGHARKYLRGRGFDGDAARQFVLGYSPDDWDALSKHLQAQKFSRDDLVSAGLAFVNKANRLQDQFRGRLMFPIYDARGDAVGFGGRALGDDGPKYKNSPESPVYQKSRLLYGLNWAKAEVVARNEVVICEGYTDVMAYTLAGAPNSVATCGTALADEHAKMLKNLARRVVLAYDSDAAGQGAAEKWYRWEQELELEVRVADLPQGKDPGDLWNGEATLLLPSLEAAVPFLQFRVDRVLEAADLTTIEGRARAAAAAARMVAEHPSELVRDQYAVQLAGRLDLDADGMRAQVASPLREPPRDQRSRRGNDSERGPDGDAPERVAAVMVNPREVDVLRWAIHEPEYVNEWLDGALLLDPVARDAYEQLVTHDNLHEAIESAEGSARQLLERLAVEDPEGDDEPETVRARLIVNTVVPVAKRMLARMMRDGDERASTVNRELDIVAHAREVGEWERAQEAAKQLVGWVVAEARSRGADPGEPTPAETQRGEVRVEQEA
jgi:DNA primase